MQSPLQRLYKTKFVLVAIIATIVGILLLLVAGWPSWQAAASLVGGALATAGLIGVWFQYIGNADATEENERQFRVAVRQEASAIRDSVIDAMAFTPEKVLDVMEPSVVDRVVENSLAKQLGDHEFASDVYADLKAQLLRSRERWRNLRISVSLSRWNSPIKSATPMLAATFRYDYRARNLGNVLRFASVSDHDEYRRLQADPTYTEVWYVGSSSGLDGASPDAFELIGASLNGQPQKISRSTKAGAQFFAIYPDTSLRKTDKEVDVSFTYRGLVLRRGHLLYIDLAKPVKGLTIGLTYGGTGIQHISVVDYIAAAKQPVISKVPATDPSPSVGLTFDGWVMPKGGVAFVWVLDGEMSTGAKMRRNRTEMDSPHDRQAPPT